MSVHSIRIDSECGNEFPSVELEFISGEYLYGYRESQSEMANHPTEVVGSDDLNRIISGFVPQQDNVLTQCKSREMAYRAQDSDSQMKPIKIFDMKLQVRSDPNVVNAFKWRKNDRTITFFTYVNNKFNTRKVISTSLVVYGDNLYVGENDDMRKHLRGYYYLCACCVPSSVPPIAVSDDSIDTVTFGCHGNSQTHRYDTRSSHGLHNDLCHPPHHHGVARSYTPVLSYIHLPNFIVGFGYYFTVHFDGTSPSSSHFVCDHVTKSTLQSFNPPIYPKLSVCFNGFNVLLEGLPISETREDNTVVYAVPYTSEDMCGIVSTVMSSSSCFDVMMNVNGETYCVSDHHKFYLTSYQDFVDIVVHSFHMHYSHHSQYAVRNDGGESSSCSQSTSLILGHNLCHVGSVYFVQTHNGSLMQAHNGSLMCLFEVKSVGAVFSCHLQYNGKPHAITYAHLVGTTRDATVLRDDDVKDICLKGNALERISADRSSSYGVLQRISADRLSSHGVWVWFDTTTTTSCHGIGAIPVKRSALIRYRTGLLGIADCITVALGAKVKSSFEACEHNTAWNAQALSSVTAASAVVICASSPCTIILSRQLLRLLVQLQSLDVYFRIVLHSFSMHYSHYSHCATHNDGGESSYAQLLLMIFGHNLCRLGYVYPVQTHDGSIIVQAHDGSLMCLSIKSLILRSHEKKAFIIAVQSHHLMLHHLCWLVCLGHNEVNGESSAFDWSQFVPYTGAIIGDTTTSWGASNGDTSFVDYFSMSRENGELVNYSIKPKEYGQHNACARCVVASRKHEETTVCSVDTHHPLHREVALQTGIFVLIVCLVFLLGGMLEHTCATRNHTLRTTGLVISISSSYEVTHVLSSAESPGLLVRRFDEFDLESRKVALPSHIIGWINDHLVSVYTDNSVLIHVTEVHVEEGKRGAYNWEEEWGEYICKDESSLQVSLRRVALALLVGCRFVASCVPTWRDVVSYICKTSYDGRYNDSAVDSTVNTMAPTTYEMLSDVSCIDVKTYVGAKSYDLSCERLLCYDLSDFLKILCYRMDMLMRRYIMKYMKFVFGKRRSHMLSTDLDTSFGNALLVLHLASSYGRLYYPARSTSQRCIFSMASSSKVLLRSATLFVGNNISSAFYGTALPYWRVRKLLQALACWFTTICNTNIIMLNYGEHIIVASIGYVSIVYVLLLTLFKFILYYRNNRYDFTRIDRWGVSHNFDFQCGLCRNGSIRYVGLFVRTCMRHLYERVYGGISTEMTMLSSFTK